MEYGVGEMLVSGGYKVAVITRKYVSLEIKDVNTGRITKREIPIAEDAMDQISLRRAVQ